MQYIPSRAFHQLAKQNVLIQEQTISWLVIVSLPTCKTSPQLSNSA